VSGAWRDGPLLEEEPMILTSDDISYELIITRRQPNPKFREYQMAHGPHEEPFLTHDALRISVTPAQFEAIRKAVLEVF